MDHCQSNDFEISVTVVQLLVQFHVLSIIVINPPYFGVSILLKSKTTLRLVSGDCGLFCSNLLFTSCKLQRLATKCTVISYLPAH